MTIHDLDGQLENLNAYWQGWGHRERSDGPDVVFHSSGLQHPLPNGVTHSAAPAGQLLPELRERLADVPWAWQVTELAPEGTAEELLALGGSDLGSIPVMALDVEQYQPLVPTDQTPRIEQLPAGADLTEWAHAWGGPLGMPAEDMVRLPAIDAGRPYEQDALARFVAVVDGRVVATTEVLMAGGVAGLYLVATLEPYQRRGLATALVDAAVRHAADAGAPLVTLQASEAGARVYERLGFETVSQIRVVGFGPTAPDEPAEVGAPA